VEVLAEVAMSLGEDLLVVSRHCEGLMENLTRLLVASRGEVEQAEVIPTGREPGLALREIQLSALFDCFEERLLGLGILPGLGLGAAEGIKGITEGMGTSLAFDGKVAREPEMLESRLILVEAVLHHPEQEERLGPSYAVLEGVVVSNGIIPLHLQFLHTRKGLFKTPLLQKSLDREGFSFLGEKRRDPAAQRDENLLY
jgi:hypothetical protein